MYKKSKQRPISTLLCCAALSIASVCYSVPAKATAGWLSTNGNQIRNAQGQPWHGFGANLHDVEGCNACNAPNYNGNHYNADEVNRRMDTLVDVWGATFIRLVLEDDRSSYTYSNTSSNITDDASYLSAIQKIVAHAATKSNLYIMLSVWQNPTVPNADKNGNPIDKGWWPTTAEQSALQKLVDTFYSYPNVIFGITNEPEMNYSGSEDAQVWSLMNQSVQTIRDREAYNGSQQHIIAVQGTRSWAGNIDYYVQHPIQAYNGTNIAYEIHVYQPSTSFNAMFVNNAKTLPVIIGEFGPNGQGMSLGDAMTLQSVARNLEIPYLAWTFHYACFPNLLQDKRSSVSPYDNCGVNMPLVATNTNSDGNYPNTGWGQIVQQDLQAGWPNLGSGSTTSGGTSSGTTSGGTSSGTTSGGTSSGTTSGGTGTSTTTGGAPVGTTSAGNTTAGGPTPSPGGGTAPSVPQKETIILD